MAAKGRKTVRLGEKHLYLLIGESVFFNDPTCFDAESFEDFIVVTVLGELIVAISSEACVDLGGYGAPPSLPPPVVLPLLPRGEARARGHGGGGGVRFSPSVLGLPGWGKMEAVMAAMANGEARTLRSPVTLQTKKARRKEGRKEQTEKIYVDTQKKKVKKASSQTQTQRD